MAGTAERTLALKLIADVNGLKKLDKGTRQLGKFSKSVLSWGKALSGALVIGGIEKVVTGLRDAWDGFRSGEKAALGMRRAWKNLRLDGSKFKTVLDRVTDSTLRLGTSDDEAVQAFTRSLSTTRDYGESLRRLTIAQDLVANGSAPNLESAFKMIMQASKGSARVVDRFGLTAETSGGRVRELGRAVRGAAKDKARLEPLGVLFNRMGEDLESIVGSFAKGDFSGFVKGLQGLGQTVSEALFGREGRGPNKKHVKGLVDQLGGWGKKMADGLIKGISEVDWGAELGKILNTAVSALSKAGDNGTLSTLAVLGTAIAAGIFAVDLFVTAITSMFKLPVWAAKGTVALAVGAVGTVLSGVFTIAMWTGKEAVDLLAGGAKWAFGKLKNLKGIVAMAVSSLGSAMGGVFIAAFAGALVGIAAKNLIADKLSEVFRSFGVPDDVIQAGRKSGDFGNPLSLLENIINGVFGGGKAAGGPVSGGKSYLVGERGPEMFVPGSSGRIVPNHAMAGSSSNYSISVYVAPGGDQVETGRAVVRAIQEYEKRAGRTWRN
jgi:hypothetical protein